MFEETSRNRQSASSITVQNPIRIVNAFFRASSFFADFGAPAAPVRRPVRLRRSEKCAFFSVVPPPSKKSGKIRFSPCAHARFAVRFGEKGTKGAPRSFRLRFSGVFARLSTGFRRSARNGTPNGNPPFSILRFLLPVRRQLQPFLAPCLV